METTKLSLAEQLKNELMERYGLEADQIKLEIGIYTNDIALGRKILEENDMFKTRTERLKDDTACDNAYGEHIDTLWVYRRKNRSDFIHE